MDNDKKLNEILNNISTHIDLNQTIILDEIKKAWHGLGEIFYLNAEPAFFEKGKLTVLVKNKSWDKELTKLKINIINHLNRYFGKEIIKDINFTNVILSEVINSHFCAGLGHR